MLRLTHPDSDVRLIVQRIRRLARPFTRRELDIAMPGVARGSIDQTLLQLYRAGLLARSRHRVQHQQSRWFACQYIVQPGADFAAFRMPVGRSRR